MIRQRAFAAVKDGWIWSSSTRSAARDAREFVGECYRDDPSENWQVGWRRALKDGYRIRPVSITVSR